VLSNEYFYCDQIAPLRLFSGEEIQLATLAKNFPGKSALDNFSANFNSATHDLSRKAVRLFCRRACSAWAPLVVRMNGCQTSMPVRIRRYHALVRGSLRRVNVVGESGNRQSTDVSGVAERDIPKHYRKRS
jgi:hypothetical protein